MRILLIGEYNRAQRNIKKGLVALGHEAIVVSTKDGFKNVDVDIEIKENYNSFLIRKFRILIYKICRINLLTESIKHQIKANKHLLSNYDVVQYINEAPFNIEYKSHLKIFKWLKLWNPGKTFLLSCGLDHLSVDYAYKQTNRYSILTPYFEGRTNEKDHSLGLRYLTPEFKKLHTYMFENCEGVIANDLDYHMPLLNHAKYLGMIPHAIDLSELPYKTPVINDKVVIFHGINTNNYYNKGNDIFDAALEIIQKKYADKVEIITTKNLPYKTYIQCFEKAHILLDQVFAFDQGFNALEAMAKGKVVFTGAEKEWLNYYNLEEDTIAINALPDATEIAKKLEWLINNTHKITEISKNARTFVETYHDHIDCAKQYLNKWGF